MTYLPDPRLVAAAAQAEARLRSRLDEFFGEDSAPVAWLDERFDGNSLGDAFLQPAAYPILSMPWWAVGDATGVEEHSQLAYSSICGYLFIRIVDDVADGDQAVPAPVLPALGFFHTEFTGVLRQWFPADHDFWDRFAEWWIGAAAAATADLAAGPIDRMGFEVTAARKTDASIIPVAAALHRVRRSGEVEAWRRFVAAFGRWHQFQNDLEGIDRDTRSGAQTWVIAEARSQAPPGVSPRGWLWTVGLAWATEVFERYAADVVAAAEGLRSAAVEQYLEQRFQPWRTLFTSVQNQLAGALTASDVVEE